MDRLVDGLINGPTDTILERYEDAKEVMYAANVIHKYKKSGRQMDGPTDRHHI